MGLGAVDVGADVELSDPPQAVSKIAAVREVASVFIDVVCPKNGT